jgi:hypothetical protein
VRGEVIKSDFKITIKEAGKIIKYKIELLSNEGDFADYLVINDHSKGRLILTYSVNEPREENDPATLVLIVQRKGRSDKVDIEKIYYLIPVEE